MKHYLNIIRQQILPYCVYQGSYLLNIHGCIRSFQTMLQINKQSALCVDLAKVCGVDLRDASHEQAVEAIRRAGDSVVFLVQSGHQRSQVQSHLCWLTMNCPMCIHVCYITLCGI